MTPGPPRERPLPVVTAFVLCDHVHQDPETRKLTVLGTCTKFAVTHRLPARCEHVGVYARVSSVRGPCVFTVEMSSAADHRPVGTPAYLGEAGPSTPLQGFELFDNYPDVGVPGPGEYLVRLCADGRPIQEVVVSFDIAEAD